MAPQASPIAASSAAVTCSVVASPPRSGVWLARSSSTVSMAAGERRGRVGVAEVVEHQRPRPHLADGVRDPLPGDVGGRAVDGLEHRRVVALRVEVRRRRDADAARDRRRQVAEDVAEEVRADDHVERLRAGDDPRAQRVDEHALDLDRGMVGGDGLDDLVPERHRVDDPVGLRRRDEPARALLGEAEGVAARRARSRGG